MDYFLINNDFKLIKDDENRSWSGSVNIYKSIKSYFKEFNNYNITLNVEKTSTDEDLILIQINIKIADIFKNKKNKFSLEKSSFSLFRTKKAILDFYNIDTDLKILSNLKFLEILHFFKELEIEIISEHNNLYLLCSTTEIDVTETVTKCLDLIDIIKINL